MQWALKRVMKLALENRVQEVPLDLWQWATDLTPSISLSTQPGAEGNTNRAPRQSRTFRPVRCSRFSKRTSNCSQFSNRHMYHRCLA